MAKITPARPIFDRRASEAIKKLQTEVDRHSDSHFGVFRKVVANQLQRLRKADLIRSAVQGKPPTSGFPPSVGFSKPPRLVARSRAFPGFPLCTVTTLSPPYLAGSPLAPVITTTAPPYSGIVSYAHAIPEYGQLALLGVTFNDDATAIVDTSGWAYRRAKATLLLGLYLVPPSAIFTTLRLAVNVMVQGSTLPIIREGEEPLGVAGMICWIRLRANLVPGGAGPFVDNKTALCRILGPPPDLSYGALDLQNVSDTIPLTVTVPVSAWGAVVFAVTGELMVGVSGDSNLYVSANFSPLSSWWQGPGMLTIPSVSVTHC